MTPTSMNAPPMNSGAEGNAIPYVVVAKPGIRTTADLPQIIASMG
jgi:hypothetical protein